MVFCDFSSLTVFFCFCWFVWFVWFRNGFSGFVGVRRSLTTVAVTCGGSLSARVNVANMCR